MSAARLWIPPAALAAAIFVLSSLSRIPGGERVWDKLAHALVFGLLAALALRAAHGGRRVLRPRPTLVTATAVVVWGILDEVHQRFVPGRTASVLDVLADGVGVVVGIGSWALLARGPAARIPPTRAETGEEA